MLRNIGRSRIGRLAFNFVGVVAWLTIAAASYGSNAVPHLDLPIRPTSAKPGSSAFTLIVNGSGFTAQSIVNWNGSPRATIFVGSAQLTATILAADVAIQGTASVSVSNPPPGGGTSNIGFFQITFHEPAIGLGIKGACASPPAAIADFNSDGKLDLAVFNVSRSNSVSIMLGNGDGTFRNHGSYPAGSLPDVAAVGDFNGDGKMDLIVGTAGDNQIYVYLGNGDGTFKAKGSVRVGTRISWAAVGDVNEDGRLDLLVVDSGAVYFLSGNGDGTFQPPVILIGGGGTLDLVGDFNNDGHLDIGVGSANGVVILLGNGDGTFGSPSTVLLSGSGRIAAADLNGDGKLDLVVPTSANKSLTVLLGNGDGTFSSQVAYPLPGAASMVVVGDFNGDGNLDLVADGVNSSPFTISTSVLAGHGDGTFGHPVNYGPSDATGFPLFAGDLNGDGRLDLENGCVFVQTPIAVTLSQFSMMFPNQVVGTTSVAKQVKFTNSGTEPVNVSSIVASGDFSQANNCPAILDVFKGCMITVTFTPTTTGTRIGVVNIVDNAAGTPQVVPLTGKGVQ